MRADAQRNVEALLNAAKLAFAHDGVDAPAKQIADSAGVGVGTLYRHFPKRSDLVKAVLEHEIDATAAAARRLAARSGTHKAIIVLTDGIDTSSTMTARDVSGLASSIDVPVYVVATVPSGSVPGSITLRPRCRRPSRRYSALASRRSNRSGPSARITRSAARAAPTAAGAAEALKMKERELIRRYSSTSGDRKNDFGARARLMHGTLDRTTALGSTRE